MPIRVLILKEPVHCIYCNSNALEVTEAPIQVQRGELNREVVCSNCGKTWIEYFSIRDIEIPENYFGKVSFDASLKYGMQMPRNYHLDRSEFDRLHEGGE
jgi:hypothetical protein